MARRTGRRDLGVRGIPGTVADRGVGKVCGGCWPGCGRCQRDSRHARRGEREGDGDQGLEGG
jgi:hypothetical protein